MTIAHTRRLILELQMTHTTLQTPVQPQPLVPYRPSQTDAHQGPIHTLLLRSASRTISPDALIQVYPIPIRKRGRPNLSMSSSEVHNPYYVKPDCYPKLTYLGSPCPESYGYVHTGESSAILGVAIGQWQNYT